MIEPDYSKMVVEVYCRVTAHVISPSDLSCLHVDQDNKRLEYGPPSWIPDYSCAPRDRRHPYMSLAGPFESVYAASGRDSSG